LEFYQYAGYPQNISFNPHTKKGVRVLQICAAYKPAFIYGGPTMSVSMLSEQLAKAGVYTEVYATTANGKTELSVTPGVPVNVDGVTVTYFKRLTKDHTHFSPSLLKKLWQQAPKFDVVHIHAWWNLVSLFSCLIALLRNVTVVVSPRGTLSAYSFNNKNIGVKQLIHNLLGKPMLNKCYLHVTSGRESAAIAGLINPKSITVLPNFVKLQAYKPSLKVKRESGLKLIFFSRIEEKKGLDLLLHALVNVTVPYQLTIAGDGDENYIESLKAIVANKHIDDKISWIGFQNENKFDVLAEHDLFILPSYDENFGNAVIESLSVGTPVLVSEEVGLADYVIKNKLGWTCQTSADSITAAINNIAANKAALQQIREIAPGIIYDDFNESNLVKRYVAFYNKLIKK
jgi:glycosyltransferase involved in cell wall biosynthesis